MVGAPLHLVWIVFYLALFRGTLAPWSTLNGYWTRLGQLPAKHSTLHVLGEPRGIGELGDSEESATTCSVITLRKYISPSYKESESANPLIIIRVGLSYVADPLSKRMNASGEE